MPSEESEVKPSWADQVELGEDAALPPPYEELDEANGIRRITEYKFNEDGKKIKVVKTYKTETRRVSKSIAERKKWRKFGAASGDPPGPNPANTVISEDIFMQFVHTKEQQQEAEDESQSRIKQQKMVACRICKGDHWTTKCPYKDSLQPVNEAVAGVEGEGGRRGADTQGEANAAEGATRGGAGGAGGKYVPPSLRDGGNRRGESMSTMKKDEITIRVTNLSEDARESDLQELFQPFGQITRIFLAKDKATGQSKGFAFITFLRREDAARAIKSLSGFGYDHLILKVEWARPSGGQ